MPFSSTASKHARLCYLQVALPGKLQLDLHCLFRLLSTHHPSLPLPILLLLPSLPLHSVIVALIFHRRLSANTTTTTRLHAYR